MARDIDFSKQLTEDEAEYVRARPWIIADAKLRDVTIVWPEDEAPAATADEDDDTEEVDYNDLDVAELKAEIKTRQEAGHDITPTGTKKADLVAALVADDEA